jgi:hypothetical protein
MMARWLFVDDVKTSSTLLNRETWELHPAVVPATIRTAIPRARLRPFAFKILNCIAFTRRYPVQTDRD